MNEKAEDLAQRFHETYERLAPEFGYRTREASAKPWSDVPEQNKQLMIAVCRELLSQDRGLAAVTIDIGWQRPASVTEQGIEWAESAAHPRCPADGSAGYHDWVDGECAQCGCSRVRLPPKDVAHDVLMERSEQIKCGCEGSCPVCRLGEVGNHKCDNCKTEFCPQCHGIKYTRVIGAQVLPCRCGEGE
jgi:hypothetical protein